MAKTTAIVFALVFICGSAHALTEGDGSCPNPPVKQNFIKEQYYGKWFSIQKTFFIYSLGARCTQATYTPKTNGRIRVENLSIDNTTNEVRGIVGEAYPPNPAEPAKLAVDFGFGDPGPYWVLETDYNTFTVVYSCRNLTETTYGDTIWILGRTRTLPDTLIQRLKDFISNLGLRAEGLEKTDQTNCD